MTSSISIVYDGDGNRVSEAAGGTTTAYLVDTLNPTGYSQVLDELASGAVTKTYSYGLQRISQNQLVSGTWTPTFYGYDGHGNVRFLTSSAGTVGNTYQFDAFGNPIASTGTTANSYLYSGERFDSNINLYHLRARYYNMQTGRFETMDPVPGGIFDPATLHLYFYTADNPVNLLDPSGNDIASYAALKKAFRGTAYQIHHLIEKRFVPIFLVAGCTISTNLLPNEHQYYTNQWRQAIGYTNGNNPTNTANVLPQQVWDAALAIYAGNAALLAAIEECRQQLGQ
jgi:RHS repeat-associated protein